MEKLFDSSFDMSFDISLVLTKGRHLKRICHKEMSKRELMFTFFLSPMEVPDEVDKPKIIPVGNRGDYYTVRRTA